MGLNFGALTDSTSGLEHLDFEIGIGTTGGLDGSLVIPLVMWWTVTHMLGYYRGIHVATDGAEYCDKNELHTQVTQLGSIALTRAGAGAGA
ncbi:hypothetical protein Tco_0974974 [Tanacetum coccineum]|uniref:Uncharacterized protein n=1 Tax=Tanacetum coccineum TaxID=301880 RepID=A0ABQ5EDA2_9ASTR